MVDKRSAGLQHAHAANSTGGTDTTADFRRRPPHPALGESSNEPEIRRRPTRLQSWLLVVADPMALLDYVLRADPQWKTQQVQERLKDPLPQRINLRTPIRVFIVYTTALAAEDGRTLFFKDIYGQDAKLQALLDARPALLPTYIR